MGTVFGGPTFWDVEQSAEVLSAYRDFILAAPRELNGFFAYTSVPPAPPFPEELHLRKVCGIVWCYVGGEEDGAAAIAPLLERTPEPLMHGVQPMPFPRCRAPSTASTRRASSGTGGPTSSSGSPTRRSRRMLASGRRCRR